MAASGPCHVCCVGHAYWAGILDVLLEGKTVLAVSGSVAINQVIEHLLTLGTCLLGIGLASTLGSRGGGRGRCPFLTNGLGRDVVRVG